MPVAPNRPKGPPLNAMRAFEAAARLESFLAAAEELGVTAGAVSQHIKTVESWVGRPLFQRNAQGVELTALARTLLPDFVAAFDAMGAATQALRLQHPKAEIHLAALPSVAQLWLLPRLDPVRKRMPDLKISVTAMEKPPNLARELFDISLFFEESETGDNGFKIEGDEMYPVCAPALLPRLQTPADLDTVPLLQDQTWKDDWALWSRSTGVAVKNPSDGPRYSLYSMALEEAKAGAGLLMGHASLVADALRSGSLVKPFALSCATGKSLVMRLADRRKRSPAVDTIADLLIR